MTTIHVGRGIEFKRDLYSSANRKPWLAEVGKVLEDKRVSVRVGQGSGAVDIKNAAELLAFYERYERDPAGTARTVGVPEGRELSEYVADLVQALDDVVKESSALRSGDKVDLTTTGELAKVLGLDDKAVRYASGNTRFGKEAPAQGTLSVLGVQLSRAASDPNDPLRDVPYIDAATFAHSGATVSGRDSVEIEAVRALTGLDSKELVALASATRGSRTVLDRMQKASGAEAYSLGYSGIGFDEMRWDGSSHRIREANPHVSLTVESGRLEVDTDDNEYEVSQGTDWFWDRYYVGKDPSDPAKDVLLDNSVSVRARVRYDTPGEARRVLIQTKLGTAVDDNGIKSAAKVDARRDNPSAADIDNLDVAVRSGKAAWSWGGRGPQPLEPLAVVHKTLSEKDALPDIGPHEDVLLLEVGTHILSERARYHLNETQPRAMTALFQEGEKWRAEVKALIEGSATLPDADKRELLQSLSALEDKSAIVSAVKAQLAALDPALAPDDVSAATLEPLWPTAARSADKLTSEKRKVVADAIKAAHDAIAERVDDLRDVIAGVDTDPLGGRFDQVNDVIDFMKTKYDDLKLKTTIKPFLDKLDEELAGPDKDAFVKELATYLKEEERDDSLETAPDKDAALAALRKNLASEHLEILHRQLEAAGTMAQSLWFDDVRAVFTGASRTTWNFLIDTFDYVQGIAPDAWERLTPEQRDGRAPVPADAIYFAQVSADVQIELGSEAPYLKAIDSAKAQLDDARAGLFMQYAVANASTSGVSAGDAASFAAYLDAARALPDAERDGLFSALNAFASDKGSPVAFDEATFARLSKDRLTDDVMSRPVDGHAALQRDLATAQLIWSTMTKAQEYVVDLRGERVLDEAEDAGVRGVTWAPVDTSKGEAALRGRPGR